MCSRAPGVSQSSLFGQGRMQAEEYLAQSHLERVPDRAVSTNQDGVSPKYMHEVSLYQASLVLLMGVSSLTPRERITARGPAKPKTLDSPGGTTKCLRDQIQPCYRNLGLGYPITAAPSAVRFSTILQAFTRAKRHHSCTDNTSLSLKYGSSARKPS